MSPLVLVVGALIGLSLGVLGGGGSILTVPALVYLVGQDAHEATAGSLVIVGPTSLIALIPHARRGNVRFTQGLIFGVLGAGGAVVAGGFAARGDEALDPAAEAGAWGFGAILGCGCRPGLGKDGTFSLGPAFRADGCGGEGD